MHVPTAKGKTKTEKTMLDHELSDIERFKICWTSSLFTFIQKVRWTYGFLRNKIRSKQGLEPLPIKI